MNDIMSTPEITKKRAWQMLFTQYKAQQQDAHSQDQMPFVEWLDMQESTRFYGWHVTRNPITEEIELEPDE